MLSDVPSVPAFAGRHALVGLCQIREQHIKAGTSLDFEAKSSYSATVDADDATDGATPDTINTFTLTLTDVNEAPAAIADQTAQTGQLFTLALPGTTFADADAGDFLAFSASLVDGAPLPYVCKIYAVRQSRTTRLRYSDSN